MPTCLCPAPTSHLTILRESWTTRAPHVHRARPKNYPRRLSICFTIRDLFIRKDRKPPRPITGFSSTNYSSTMMPPPLRRKIPPPKDLPLYLPPHLPTNVGKQVNTPANAQPSIPSLMGRPIQIFTHHSWANRRRPIGNILPKFMGRPASVRMIFSTGHLRSIRISTS